MHSGFENADYHLASAYAQNGLNRRVLAVALAFDDHIRHQIYAAREPVFAQLRLAWWRDQIAALKASVTGLNDPLLIKIAAITPNDVMPEVWTSIIDGWEASLGDWDHDVDMITAFAQGRGRGVFSLFGDEDEALLRAGEGWALADLAFQMSDPQRAKQLIEHAMPRLDNLKRAQPRSETRGLRVLAALTMRDAVNGYPRTVKLGSPRRMFWALRYALAHRSA
jgi:15-cis-phytoene synthase